MKLEKIRVIGFRGLVKEEFDLKDLTVFPGEMGSGKTSRLLAILYALTGAAPKGLSLDDLIHVDSQYLWVKAAGTYDGTPFTLERRKSRGQASVLKTEPPHLELTVDEKLFIEGREIAALLIGAPAEKLAKIDELLGYTRYGQIIHELSTAPLERWIKDATDRIENARKLEGTSETLRRAREALEKTTEQLRSVEAELEAKAGQRRWAEEIKAQGAAAHEKLVEIEAKKNLIQQYSSQLEALPKLSAEEEEAGRELEAQFNAIQTRITFLEAAIHVLDLAPGERVEKRTLCPVCGALITPAALDRFKGYADELKRLIPRADELEQQVLAKRKELQEARQSQERRNFLQSEINRLQIEVADISITTVAKEDVERAEALLHEGQALLADRQRLEIEKQSRVREVESLKQLVAETQQLQVSALEQTVEKLRRFKDQILRIRTALTITLNEVRLEQLNQVKVSFKEVFRKIYPYPRIREADFEIQTHRGKEVLLVKAEVDGTWLKAAQLSTGENVALSFGLLCAINNLEKAPILLLDEPEEGLDEKGVEGLAAVLKKLSGTTQIVIATRSQQLARLLS